MFKKKSDTEITMKILVAENEKLRKENIQLKRYIDGVDAYRQEYEKVLKEISGLKLEYEKQIKAYDDLRNKLEKEASKLL